MKLYGIRLHSHLFSCRSHHLSALIICAAIIPQSHLMSHLPNHLWICPHSTWAINQTISESIRAAISALIVRAAAIILWSHLMSRLPNHLWIHPHQPLTKPSLNPSMQPCVQPSSKTFSIITEDHHHHPRCRTVEMTASSSTTTHPIHPDGALTYYQYKVLLWYLLIWH